MAHRQQCEGCTTVVEGPDLPAFGDAFIAHVRSSHPDWPYPDVAIRSYAEATQRLTGPTERLAAIGEVTIHPVAPDRIDDWLGFFDHDAFAGNPADAACYCTEPHLLTPEATEGVGVRPWRDNRELMAGLLAAGRAYGYLAYVDGTPAAWINASMRAECTLYRQGDGTDAEVVSVSCIGVAPPYRGHGLPAALLDRVLADAPARGATWVEAYPFHDEEQLDLDNWRGHRSLFTARGFEVIQMRQRDSVLRRRAG